jgi:hypothetical protein
LATIKEVHVRAAEEAEQALLTPAIAVGETGNIFADWRFVRADNRHLKAAMA